VPNNAQCAKKCIFALPLPPCSWQNVYYKPPTHSFTTNRRWAHKLVARIPCQWQRYHTLVPPRAPNRKTTIRRAGQRTGHGPGRRPRGAVAGAPNRNGGGPKVAASPAAAAPVSALCRHNGRPGVLDLLRALVVGSLRRHVLVWDQK
jgi:hypothetical protein